MPAAPARSYRGDADDEYARARRLARERMAAYEYAPPPRAANGRRTVTIRGQVAPPPRPRLVDVDRRRPPRRAHERIGPRPDRVAMWAVLLGLFLVLVAVSTSHAAPRAHAAARYSHPQLGARTLGRGMAGEDVRTLQRLLSVTPSGYFGAATLHAVRAFQRGAGLVVDGRVGPATRAALARLRMVPRMATFFGPGLYGQHTACGQRLTPHLRGVAHKHLPCGTLVTLEHDGRFTTARVVDRGPYTRGVTFDLTAATARALGLSSTAQVHSRVV